jgi:hypothetical protein
MRICAAEPSPRGPIIWFSRPTALCTRPETDCLNVGASHRHETNVLPFSPAAHTESDLGAEVTLPWRRCLVRNQLGVCRVDAFQRTRRYVRGPPLVREALLGPPEQPSCFLWHVGAGRLASVDHGHNV